MYREARVQTLVKMLLWTVLFFALVIGLFRFAPAEVLAVMLTLACLGPLVFLALDRFAQRNQLLRLQEEALRAELALLKNQINPHFFFNTLNNLYGLVREGSDQAAAMIVKLGDLMRFSIYQGGKDHVPLLDEVAYVQNFLDLQRIRWRPDRVDVRFDCEMADATMDIPPLLLIVLVENAFKHGVAHLSEQAFVHMQLVADGNSLQFRVENNVADEPLPSSTGGLGLTNLRRRLALLFPNTHDLVTERRGNCYHAELRLTGCAI